LEFSGDLALEKILPRLREVGRLSHDEAAAAERVLTHGKEGSQWFLEVVQQYVDHGLGPVMGGPGALQQHQEED
jgi:hypothetical protein